MAHCMPAVRDRRLEIVELVAKLYLPKTGQFPFKPAFPDEPLNCTLPLRRFRYRCQHLLSSDRG